MNCFCNSGRFVNELQMNTQEVDGHNGAYYEIQMETSSILIDDKDSIKSLINLHHAL